MADRGYTAMPPVDELSCRTYRAELGRGLKSRPLSKACRVASNLGKFTPLDGGSNEKDITTGGCEKAAGGNRFGAKCYQTYCPSSEPFYDGDVTVERHLG